MNPGERLLQELLVQLRPWQAYIQRATGSTVTFITHENREFSVCLEWRDKTGKVGQFQKRFTPELCFGVTHKLQPLAWRHQRKACEHARGIVREVLQVRGVL